MDFFDACMKYNSEAALMALLDIDLQGPKAQGALNTAIAFKHLPLMHTKTSTRLW